MRGHKLKTVTIASYESTAVTMTPAQRLSEHDVFADADSILGRAYETYDFLLENLGWPRETSPDGQHLVSRDFVFDTVNRMRLDEVLRFLGKGDSWQPAFHALRKTHSASSGKLIAAEAEAEGVRSRLQHDGLNIDVVVDPEINAPGHRTLNLLYQKYISDDSAQDFLAQIDHRDEAALASAMKLLRALMSPLYPEILRHVQYIAKIAGPKAAESVSTRQIPGVVFISDQPFRKADKLAEDLLHEALHQRFCDLTLTRQIFIPDYSSDAAPTIAPEWHANSADPRWPIDRGLAAAHVYVHLTAWFHMLASHHRDPAAHNAALRSKADAAGRAESLLGKVASVASGQLGPSGMGLLNWLHTAFNEITDGSVPQSPGYYLE